jgi:hypothetical protein
MFSRLIPVLLVAAVSMASLPVQAETYGQERRAHPRIAKAIHHLRDAVAYMEAAPHDFGGHKAAAIASSNQAIRDLQEALKYREGKDTRNGK